MDIIDDLLSDLFMVGPHHFQNDLFCPKVMMFKTDIISKAVTDPLIIQHGKVFHFTDYIQLIIYILLCVTKCNVKFNLQTRHPLDIIHNVMS